MCLKKIKKLFFLSFFIFGFAGLIDLQTLGLSFTDLITHESSEYLDFNTTPLTEDFSGHNQEPPSDDDTPNDDFHLLFDPFNLNAFLQKTYNSDILSNHPEPIAENLVPPPELQV